MLNQGTLLFNYATILRSTLAAIILSLLSNTASTADIKLPLLGDSSSGIVSKNQEYKLGKSWLQAFRRQVKQYDDPLLQAYLEQLSFDLVAHSDLDDPRLTLVLINNPNINAFAVPGGIIGIHTGIFSYADNEDQLAAIISHELAHLSQRHFARGIEAQRSTSAINLAGLLATIVVSSKAGADAGLAALSATQALSVDQQLRYSRLNEQEADRLGIKIMERAGRNPRAATDILEKMMALTRYKGSRVPEFLLTHPITERRVADTKLRTYNQQPRHFPNSYDFYIMQARTLILLQDNPDYSVKYFRQKLASNTLNNDASRYGLAIAQSKLGNFIQAKNILGELLENKPFYGPYIYTDIEIEIAAQHYKSALKKLNDQLTLNQNNYPLKILQADALWKTHQYDAAANILTKLSRQRPEDPMIWYQLAEVRGLAGNISGVHTARAEYFILVGALDNAKRQLGFATKLLAADFKRLSVVRQRLAEIDKMEKNLRRL